MKGSFIVFGLLFIVSEAFSQSVTSRLEKIYQQFERDEQMKHALSSLFVVDANTGEIVFDRNSQIGLAPASTQKIITAATAFELLGKNYRYKTDFGKLYDRFKDFYFWIKPSGDPTFGSWRWANTRGENIIESVLQALRKTDLKGIKGMMTDATAWEQQYIPDGWIWEDIGNYYGAGAAKLNWRENQFDLILKSGKNIGDSVRIVATEPKLYSYRIYSEVTAAEKGTGDNAYIYFPVGNTAAVVKGTIPVNEDRFRISGALINPAYQFLQTLTDSLRSRFQWNPIDPPVGGVEPWFRKPTIYYTHSSPTLDSINYWFLKKSINLYGEALVKTIAYEKQGYGSTDSGLAIMKKFWKEKGIDEDELNIYDGSGLSPLNRLTTHAQVKILKYARSKEWFPHFFEGFPEYNGMRIKSGTINDVKGYCGYHKAKDGSEYIFSFLVNNYSGRASALVSKMFKVLDELK